MESVGGSYDAYLGTGNPQPTASSVPVVGIENVGDTFATGIFNSLTIGESFRAIDSGAFANNTGLTTLYWNTNNTEDGDTVYVAADAFDFTNLSIHVSNSGLMGKLPAAFPEDAVIWDSTSESETMGTDPYL